MKYRNIKTGAVIDAYGTIKGENWEAIPSSPAVSEKAVEPAKEAPVEKKTTKSKAKRK